MQGDGARLIAAHRGDAAVQAPERGEPGGGDVVAEGVRCAAEHGAGLVEVVLEEPGLGQGAPDGEVLLTHEDGGPQQRREDLDGLGSAAAFDCAARTREQRLQ